MFKKVFQATILAFCISQLAHGESFFEGLVSLEIPVGYQRVDMSGLPGGSMPAMPGVETTKYQYTSGKGSSIALVLTDFHTDLLAAGITPAFVVQTNPTMGEPAIEPQSISLGGVQAAKLKREVPTNTGNMLFTSYGAIVGSKSILLVAGGLGSSEDYRLAINAIEAVVISTNPSSSKK